MGKTSAKIKRPLWIAGLNIALALSVGATQAFAVDITSVEELLEVNNNRDGDYFLKNDLVLSTDDVAPDSSAYIFNAFTGTFDGGGFTIYGLTKPLFNVIDGEESIPTTTISDLTLEAAAGGVNGQGILTNVVNSGTVITDVHVIGTVNGGNNVGGLVGYNGGDISNSSATGGAVTGGDYVGGLVGFNEEGSISNSYATGAVTGNLSVGGLIGRNYYGTIDEDSYATGIVTGNVYVGGLVGDNFSGEISNSTATGAVAGDDSVGGLVGYNSGEISNSSAAGAVTGGDYVGGLVGLKDNGNISYSSAIGIVDGHDYVGGLVGKNNNGIVSNSDATGGVAGNYFTGGLVGENVTGAISNSYATGGVSGVVYVGGLVGLNNPGGISNSYAIGAVTGVDSVGGLVGQNGGAISNSYAMGGVNGDYYFDGLVGFNNGDISNSYATGSVHDVPSDDPPLSLTELLSVLNTGSAPDSPIFALDPAINNGLPYLLSNLPPSEDNGNEEVSIQIDFTYLLTQVLDALRKSVGFKAAKSDLSKLDFAILDQVKDAKSAQIIGGKLFTNQYLSTFLSVGSLLQLEIDFEASKSLQMWIKGSNNQYIFIGDMTFDKDGNAVLPGIEFKKSGQYELIFVNSDKKDLTQPELVNKVSGLTVYVNQ